MSPRTTSGGTALKPYYLTKLKCPFHGFYSARTERPVSEGSPVACPECIIGIEFVSTIKGLTSQSMPFVSKPRWPKKTDIQPIASDKAPLRKRGVSW